MVGPPPPGLVSNLRAPVKQISYSFGVHFPPPSPFPHINVCDSKAFYGVSTDGLAGPHRRLFSLAGPFRPIIPP